MGGQVGGIPNLAQNSILMVLVHLLVLVLLLTAHVNIKKKASDG